MSDSEAEDDSDSVSSIFLPDETSEECHERWCSEGDGWSHAFSIWYGEEDDSDRADRTQNIDAAMVGAVTVPEDKRQIIKCYARENWERAGRAISQYTNLTQLKLFESALSDEAITLLLGGSSACCFPLLEDLNLYGNQLEPNHMRALLPFLKARSTLKRLNLNCTGLTDEGAGVLSEALHHTRIRHLHLSKSRIGANGLEYLFSAPSSRHLTELDLDECDGIGTEGFSAISRFLQRTDTELKTMCVSPVDVATANMLVESVSNKSKLRSLDLWGDGYPYNERSNQNFLGAMPTIQRVVANTISFETLVDSNHNLGCVGGYISRLMRYGGDACNLIMALEINRRDTASMSKKIRRKLRAIYFLGEYDVQPFALMDAKLLPYVLELVTKTEVRDCYKLHSLQGVNVANVYRIVRNCHVPELFSFPRLTRVIPLEEANHTLVRLRNNDDAAPKKRTKSTE